MSKLTNCKSWIGRHKFLIGLFVVIVLIAIGLTGNNTPVVQSVDPNTGTTAVVK
ncbi:MAG TPA: hypothetical protein VIM70_21005 [Clostridium sp.]|uniref:hypothetical protein n=1 Tax=Clostridium sp. TaxID=1506 RepID=UPI002F956F1A